MGRETKVPALPDVNHIKDPQTQRVLRALSEAVDIRLGRRGDALDRAVTVRDLFENGVVSIPGLGFSGKFRGDLRPALTVSPANPYTPTTTPPVPTGLTAAAAPGVVMLVWDSPYLAYPNHSYTEIWRADSDDLGSAVKVGQTTAGVYGDQVTDWNRTLYYWVRFVSEVAVTGPYNATAGTQVTTTLDVNELLGALSGQVLSSHLHTTLSSRIDLIDSPVTGLVAQMTDEIGDRQQAVSDLQNQIDGLVLASDIDIYYQDTPPTGSIVAESRWFDTGDDNHPYLYHDDQWQSARDLLITVLSTNLNTEVTNRTTADTAQVARLDVLEADVFDPVNGVAANASAVGGLDTRVTTAEDTVTAHATQLTSLNSEVFDGGTGVGALNNALGALDVRVNSAEGTITAQGQSITSLNNQLTNTNDATTANANALSSLTTRVTITENGVASHTDQLTALESTVNDPSTGVVANADAAQQLGTRLTTAEGSITSQGVSLTSLQSSIGGMRAGKGVNLVKVPYADWEVESLPPIGGLANGTVALDTVVRFFGSRSLKFTCTANDARFYLGVNSVNYNITIAPNRKWLVSCYVRSDIASANGQIMLRANLTGTHHSMLFVTDPTPLTWSRIYSTIDLTNHSSDEVVMRLDNDSFNQGGADMWFDGLMLEEVVGDGLTEKPSAWVAPIEVVATSEAHQALTTRVTQAEDGVTTNASAITALQVTVDDPSTGVTASAGAISGLDVRVTEAEDDITAQAEQYTQLNTTVGGHSTTIQNHTQSIGGLSAQHTVKVDANGYVAGYGLAVTSEGYDPGEGHSLMEFLVDTFAITSPGADSLSFVVDNGKVLMDAVYIKDLTVTSAQVQDLAATKLTGFDVSFINAKLGSAWIDNAMIGNVIQSSGYVAGQSGWRIDKAGNCELNSIVVYNASGQLVFNVGGQLNWDNANVSGTNRPADGATVGADWASNVTGIPYATVFNNDDSVALGFNPSFSAWSGVRPDNWSIFGTGDPIKETTLVRVGEYAVRYSSVGTSRGLQRTATFASPLPVGTFLSGSVDIYLESVTSGLPGFMVRLLTNAGLTTYSPDTKIQPPDATTGGWHRIPWTARVGEGEQIYAIRMYIMASYGGFATGHFTGDVIFDNLRFALFDKSLDNNDIVLNPDGTLDNAGGGGVTITGLGYAGDMDATRGATWGVDVTGIPYSTIYNNDDSVAMGFNPSFSDWPSGSDYPAGWVVWSTAPPIKETSASLVRVGPYSARYVTTGSSLGMQCVSSFGGAALPVGTFLGGSIDMHLVAVTSGLPGIMVRLYTNAALNAFRDTKVQPASSTTGGWQRVPWTARVYEGEQIYGVRIFVMASYASFASGHFTGEVVYDNLRFALFDQSVDNTVVKLNDNGTLSGGGGGGVSISGLGYSGSMDADKTGDNPQGANWITDPVVWSGNKITPANVDVYMASAAVDTLYLSGKALSFPVNYTIDTSLLLTKNAWSTLSTLSYTNNASPVTIIAYMGIRNDSGADDGLYVKVSRQVSGGSWTQLLYLQNLVARRSCMNSWPFVIADVPTANVATVSYKFEVYTGDGSIYRDYVSVTIIEGMDIS